MKEIIFALIAGGLGFALLTFGYKLARVIIPLWGFFAGFTIGAAGVADATAEGFISTTLGIVVGLVLGLVFGLFSYFFYSLAVVLLGASVGYWIGTGFMSLFGLDSGFLSAVAGISLGVVFALLTIGLNGSKYLLIALTSLAGSVAMVGGILVLFGQIEPSAFDYTTAKTAINDSWFWGLVTAGLLGFGLAIQYVTNQNYVLDSWTTEYGAPKSKTVYKD